jgi:6-phosphogluconolactonase
VLHVFPDPRDAAAAVAERIAAAAARATGSRGRFRIGLPGGTTPLPLYSLLVERGPALGIDWSSAEVAFTDERAVPPDHPDSNFRLIHDLLLEPLGVPPRNVHRLAGEADDLDRAAREYESWLEPPLDFILLGMGRDGHVASIFPGSRVVAERKRRVMAVEDAPKPPPRRLTITPRVLGEAGEVAMMAFGADKSGPVASALAEATPPERVPARLVRERDWYLDAAAASRLAAREPVRPEKRTRPA